MSFFSISNTWNNWFVHYILLSCINPFRLIIIYIFSELFFSEQIILELGFANMAFCFIILPLTWQAIRSHSINLCILFHSYFLHLSVWRGCRKKVKVCDSFDFWSSFSFEVNNNKFNLGPNKPSNVMYPIKTHTMHIRYSLQNPMFPEDAKK